MMKAILLTIIILSLISGCCSAPPQECVLTTKIACLDATVQIENNAVLMVIHNQEEFDLVGVEVYLKSQGVNYTCVDSAGDAKLEADEKETFTCSIGGLPEKLFKGVVGIKYVNSDTGLPHNRQGKIELPVVK